MVDWSRWLRVVVVVLVSLTVQQVVAGETEDPEWSSHPEGNDFDFGPAFYDRPVPTGMLYPDWFRLSFLDLADDLQAATEAGKQGLVLYLGQKNCPYCEAMVNHNFRDAEISAYAQKHFEFVAIDIHGSKSVVDFKGKEISEKALAQQLQINFTPTLLFFNAKQELVLRLNGYHPPYQFRSVLEYVADRHYLKERLGDYMARGEAAKLFAEGSLMEEPFFSPPPYALDRHQITAQRPLAVFFERPNCHACDILHSQPLQNRTVRQQLSQFEVVQLNRDDHQTPLLTPTGQKSTPKAWADELDLFYTPTLLLFDRTGQEVMRVDSVIGFLRLRSVLDYLLSAAYERGISFQEFRMNLWDELSEGEYRSTP